jgi:hypothetical protein
MTSMQQDGRLQMPMLPGFKSTCLRWEASERLPKSAKLAVSVTWLSGRWERRSSYFISYNRSQMLWELWEKCTVEGPRSAFYPTQGVEGLSWLPIRWLMTGRAGQRLPASYAAEVLLCEAWQNDLGETDMSRGYITETGLLSVDHIYRMVSDTDNRFRQFGVRLSRSTGKVTDFTSWRAGHR